MREFNLFKKMVAPLLIIVVCCSVMSFSREQQEQPLEALSDSMKLNSPGTILTGFKEGESTVHVIVNLTQSVGNSVKNLRNENVRRQLRQEVYEAQDRVINTLDSNHVYITNRFTYIFGFSAEVTQDGLQCLIDNPDVFSIDEDMIIHAHTKQGIPLMNASTVRNTYNGSGLSIAVCDTGIDYTHPMLGNGGFPNAKVIGGYDTGQNDADPMDGHGHGTSCAGIAAGNRGTTGDYIGGVAYNAGLYALKITNSSTGGSAYTSDTIEAWEWCVTHQNDKPAKPILIITHSFGSGRYYSQSACDSSSSALATAAANAKAVGITIFVSTGNDGYCDSTSRPGCLSDVIGVGAVYDAAFGEYYPCVASGSCAVKYFTFGCATFYYSKDNTAADMVPSYSNSASFLSLLAPANEAYTLDIGGGYNTSFGGTSAACPYAAGAGACLQSAAKSLTGSYLTPNQVKSYLSNNGDLITDGKVSITKPRVNLGDAVDALAAFSSITVTAPNGGESWTPGSIEDITWTTVGTVGNVKIEYSINNGGTWSTVISATADDGIYSWTVPNVSSVQCLVRVSKAVGGTPSDTSDAVFSISSTPPSIALSRSRFYYAAAISSGVQTGNQTFWISNSGGGTLNWSVTDDAAWLTCTPASNSGDGLVTVSSNAQGLYAGTYTGTITVTDPAAANSPQYVTVTLLVQSGDNPPIGTFATPVDGANTSSSIPVTGWVVDDVEVVSVKIYNSGDYVGDAVFVEGARPDIESAYPTYPMSYKAGWGYMLLSYFLPGGGNGSYTLSAVATDRAGKTTTLGSSTINIDNAGAIKPFGAIDKPEQGGIATGSSYRNSGWVLTPMPNMIPTNGSTIFVYVDGVSLGNPTYNVYRSDIASLFPGYANSDGAHAYLDIDTTKYDYGNHSIYWIATDNAGNVDGIGSRFFQVQNSGTSRGNAAGEAWNMGNSLTLPEIPVIYDEPIRIKKGLDPNTSLQEMYPDDNGIVTIRIQELELLEVRLAPGETGRFDNVKWYAYQWVGNQLRPLPVGSTLDKESGIFYWHPGPGFLGRYNLVFVQADPGGDVAKKSIMVEILPKTKAPTTYGK